MNFYYFTGHFAKIAKKTSSNNEGCNQTSKSALFYNYRVITYSLSEEMTMRERICLDFIVTIKMNYYIRGPS